MSFKVIVSADTLTDYVDTLLTVVDEAVLQFQPDKIHVEAVDPANVAMVNTDIHATACESYESDGFKIGINLHKFDEYLSGASSGDLVELTYDEEARRIGIYYGGEYTTTFDMAGIDPDSVREGQKPADDVVNQMSSDVRMDAAALKHATNVAGKVSDHLIFDADPNRAKPWHVIGEGDTDDARVEFSDALANDGNDITEPCVGLYSEEYIDALLSAVPKNADVRVRHGEEWPMLIDYTHPDADMDATLFCAPRIQSN